MKGIGISSSSPGGPQIPPRTTSSDSDKPETWKQSLGIFLAFLLILFILFSSFWLIRYAWRDKTVYDELVDYLDKTISISKINYNNELGIYEVTEKEMDALHHQRKYKSLIWIFLASDLANFVLLGIAIMLYYGGDTSRGTMHVLFWLFLGLAILYSLIEASVFTGLIFPLSGKLPNETSTLLDHAIPHNPGGLRQMEQGMGCTFDHSLYNTFKRRQNPKNTCDPFIARSYIPQGLLISFIVLRLVAILFFIFALIVRNPVGQGIANLIARSRPNGGYQNRFVKNPNRTSNFGIHTPKSTTTFGVKDNRYNNAAFFATNGGLNSSRNSDISRSDAGDIVNYKTNVHHSNSLISEV
uniref:Uncharacterized protein n=1 Tax=Panagrolaimus davidi TaxID=227884 RepID=A0A914QHH5_9BILA